MKVLRWMPPRRANSAFFQTRNRTEHLLLRPITELGLKPDHVEQSAQLVILPQLNHGMGSRAIMGVGQTDWLHGAKSQRLTAAFSHHLDGETAFKVGGVLLPFMKLDFVAFDQRVDKGFRTAPHPSGS